MYWGDGGYGYGRGGGFFFIDLLYGLLTIFGGGSGRYGL